MSENTDPSDSWQRMSLTDCVAHLWGLVSVIRSNQIFFSLSLFIHNGPWPSVILLSLQITSLLATWGAGWLVAGLNERNDQALCGSHSLFSPKKQPPSYQGKITGGVWHCACKQFGFDQVFSWRKKKTKRFWLVSKKRWLLCSGIINGLWMLTLGSESSPLLHPQLTTNSKNKVFGRWLSLLLFCLLFGHCVILPVTYLSLSDGVQLIHLAL